MNEEVIFYTLALRMIDVRWTRDGDSPDARQFKTISRKVRLFSDVTSSEQPACFQGEHGEQAAQVSGLPYKNILMANWIVYHEFGKDDRTALGASENNLILGGIRKALEPRIGDPGFYDHRNTLGGLVHHCHVSGTIFKDPGDIDGQAMLIVPIKLLVP
jgi:hypothetical protein